MSTANTHGRFKHGYPSRKSGEGTPFVAARSSGDDVDQRWDTNFHNRAAGNADRNPRYPMQPSETGHDVALKAVGATPHAPGYQPLGSKRYDTHNSDTMQYTPLPLEQPKKLYQQMTCLTQRFAKRAMNYAIDTEVCDDPTRTAMTRRDRSGAFYEPTPEALIAMSLRPLLRTRSDKRL
jgi:hypothetical protein